MKCLSTRSLIPERVAIHSVRVEFTDECYDAVVTPAIMDSFGGSLYTLISQPCTSLATVDMIGCPEPFYMIDGPITYSANTPALHSLTNNPELTVYTQPSQLGNAGEYNFNLLSCIEVGPNLERNCTPDSFSVTIVDPCLAPTVLIPEGFDRILAAPLLQSDSMLLSEEILRSGGYFPWRDTAAIDLGSGICGPVVYSIYPQDGFVAKVADTVTWSPDLSITPGDYTY